jgi:diguanylate cyclase (GGDEF)-like protein/PAS domain S-box-containing protein
MTENGGLSRALSRRDADLALCAELYLAVFNVAEDDLSQRLSAIVSTAMGTDQGGFLSAADRSPILRRLIEDVRHEDSRFGCFAYDAAETMRPRLVELARITAIALAQRKDEAGYRQIINNIYDSVIVMDMAGFITEWNNGAELMFGYRAEEVVGRNILFLYADDDTAGGEFAADSFLNEGGREMEVRRRRKSGEIFWARLSLSHMRDAQGAAIGVIGYLADITERVRARHRLMLHAKIFEQSDAAIAVTDSGRRFLAVNPAFTRVSGYEFEDVFDKRLMEVDQSGLDWKDVSATLLQGGRWEGDSEYLRKNGETFPIHISVSATPAMQGEEAQLIWIFTDISERRRDAERIHRLACYDSVTGLPNRSLLLDLAEQSLAEARRDNSSGALIFVDLNRFKPINDSLGHAAGNQLLREVGERFRHVMRDEDVVARIGDDEFVVSMFDHTHSSNPAVVAQRLLAALDVPFMINGHELRVGASIGISVYPDDGLEVETLLRNADIALYRAKQAGASSYVYYSEEMNQRSLERLQIEAGLRRALENDELLLHYQPKVDLASGAIIGAEVLVRWMHPERGLVAPGEFIPIAEESGLIVSIGNWVLEATCAQARKWHVAGMLPIRVAANLSARQFGPGLATSIRDLLLRHELPAVWLELEITESMLMNSVEHVIDMMDNLSELGVSLSLDDFGTGYSSLSYLKRFPIETIKIDRSFVKGTPQDSDDCAITAAIVSMSKQLKLRVIAEGVERGDQADFMRSLGCDEIQGYLFSPPVSVEEFEEMLLAQKNLRD